MNTVDAQVLQQASQTIANGSRSFSLAARLMDAHTRESTVLLYGWCRHCDDLIDGQTLGHEQREGTREHAAERLAQLQALTAAACAGRPSADPVFQGLAEVVRRHRIPPEWLMEHLAGFGMDVHPTRYDSLPDVLLYCWRVAGVVGVMMARIMGVTQRETLDRACDLGLAFQLTNIARDVLEDAQIGRVYLPADWLAHEGIGTLPDLLADGNRERVARVAARLVGTAEPYYRSAREGIADLPLRCAWSIATARSVYRRIGHEVVSRGAHAWDRRVATGTAEKLWYLARSAGVALAVPHLPRQPRDAALFQRPL
ncbi:phytoene/squalene synthase family protein [Ramlibacter sp. AW1]|uniref:Phytoene/squalene synthase family protein n=1 Tax=Ramlibacter aurantiacus TaxID=2801330 RepID=A0A936ZN58_9BURK|nr:phytoene/squalene synthase family protein [Ramlibacter aurantiacus]MBL0419291.1 phytoene/squalene synthase family protein [Ramlibacter aurantiacus]